MKRKLLPLFALLSILPACASARSPFASVEDDLSLDRVVLYRNGVGYFERRGEADGDVLRIRVRKDQVDDLLKSLTVVDENGQAVSVSMPLDAQSWANAALDVLGPGRGSLAEVLDAMRGSEVTLQLNSGSVRGRIVMVERTVNEPDPSRGDQSLPGPEGQSLDWKVTLLFRDEMRTVRLSKVKDVKLHNGDLAMQLHRNLDAAAGEGMFQQIEIEIRLNGKSKHDLMVSYVVSAPMWKPTYRVVLPEGGKGQALLQGWAVVDNLSGEDWSDIKLSLTSGAPIAFRYDLHTPREVPRSDLTSAGVRRQARVSMGETSFADGDMAMPEAEPMPMPMEEDEAMAEEMREAERYAAPPASASASTRQSKKADKSLGLSGTGRGGGGAGEGTIGLGNVGSVGAGGYGGYGGDDMMDQSAEYGMPSGPALDLESLRRSTAANARSKQVTGLTQTDLGSRVTVPDGTSTMVALVNTDVEAAETFLFKPGGAGYGYESNPYRVVRFKNTSEYVLEPGPISIYSGGSFVGEGLSETVGAGASVTIPFAVEPGIVVSSTQRSSGQKLELKRIVRGVIEAESFYRTTTHYEVRLQPGIETDEVLVRHSRAGSNYELAERPKGTEDLDGAYLIPIPIEKGKRMAGIDIDEETPSNITLSIWDGRAEELLKELLTASTLTPADKAKLQPIIDLRREIGRIDTEINGLQRQQVELDRRAEETRRNLEAIKKDSRAGNLRDKLNDRLDEFTREADALGRKIVELNSQRLEKKIALEDLLVDFDFRAPAKSGAKAGGAKPEAADGTKPAKGE